jgi:hypothetical protein
LVPSTALSRPRAPGRRWSLKIADLKFCLPSKRFGIFAAAIIEIAALQRGWRDFRIAQCSCEHGNPALPKNWTPKFAAIA